MIELTVIVLYLILLLLNTVYYINGKSSRLILSLSFLLMFILFSGSNGAFDGTQHDLSNYNAQYSNYNPLEDNNFGFYYIFFLLMRAGQLLDLSFSTWWQLMTATFLAILVIGLKKHNFSIHLFFIWFMLYYFIFYTGLKMFYGTCVFLFAFGYLLNSGVRNKLKFIFWTCMAGGLHVLFYTFLVLAFVNKDKNWSTKNIRKLKFISITVLIICFFLKISGSASNFLYRMFSFLDTDKTELYLTQSTNWGFFIPAGLHSLSILVLKMNKNILSLDENDNTIKYQLFNASIMMIVFFPLLLAHTVFGRLITEFSFISLCALGYRSVERSFDERISIIMYGMIILFGYYIKTFVISMGWENYITPLLNSRYYTI